MNDVHELELHKSTIRCKDTFNKEMHILGIYENRKRASEIFAEIAAQNKGYYQMPEK